jgi:hypothetical protein
VALFISASDEHSGNGGQGIFLFAGYVGPEEDWSRFFVPAWQERVLDGPPKIPYLHMTEIRGNEFRDKHGLSRLTADDRIDEAAAVIDTMGTLYPIAVEVDGGRIKDLFADVKVRRSSAKQFEAKPFEPDYLCFLAYAHTVLDYVHKKHPEAEKVDFIVEQKGVITRYINEYHSRLDEALAAIGRSDLSPLVGQLIPGDKQCIPCQAADVLCWHAARFQNAQEVAPQDVPDARRYLRLRNRKGLWVSLNNDLVSEMAAALSPRTGKAASD